MWGDPKGKGPKERRFGCYLRRDATRQAARDHGLQMEEAGEEGAKHPCYCRAHEEAAGATQTSSPGAERSNEAFNCFNPSSFEDR